MMGQNTSASRVWNSVNNSIAMPGPINSIPDDVLEEIFRRVDDKRHLLKVCTRVCKRWNDVLNWRFWSTYLINDLPEEETREYKSLFKKVPVLAQKSNTTTGAQRGDRHGECGHPCTA